MLKSFLIVILMLISMQVFSQTAASSSPSTHNIAFQVIQDEFVLDNTSVKSAEIIMGENKVYQGLHIQLKPEAAAKFSEITQAGIGRTMNLVFNKVIITASVLQTSLGDNFLISGISQQDAQAFLNVLNANKPKKEEESA